MLVKGRKIYWNNTPQLWYKIPNSLVTKVAQSQVENKPKEKVEKPGLEHALKGIKKQPVKIHQQQSFKISKEHSP